MEDIPLMATFADSALANLGTGRVSIHTLTPFEDQKSTRTKM